MKALRPRMANLRVNFLTEIGICRAVKNYDFALRTLKQFQIKISSNFSRDQKLWQPLYHVYNLLQFGHCVNEYVE